ATPSFYPLSLHDALPICGVKWSFFGSRRQAPASKPTVRGSTAVAGAHRLDLVRRTQRNRSADADRCSAGTECGREGPEVERAARSEEHTSELQSPYELVC